VNVRTNICSTEVQCSSTQAYIQAPVTARITRSTTCLKVSILAAEVGRGAAHSKDLVYRRIERQCVTGFKNNMPSARFFGLADFCKVAGVGD